MMNPVIQVEAIERRILLIHGQKVMLDADVADFYGVQTKRLNEQVKRNRKRFPSDFLFRLTEEERDEVVAKCDHLSRLKYSSTLPYAFTEHGAVMAASVLNSDRAIEISVFVVRAFTRLGRLITVNDDILSRIAAIEGKLVGHDRGILALAAEIRRLLPQQPIPETRRIGFSPDP